MSTYYEPDEGYASAPLPRQRLTEEQVKIIDEYLTSVGEYGEVHLIVQNSELRYINKIESHKAWTMGKKSSR